MANSKYYGFEDVVEAEQGIFSDGNAGIVKESGLTHYQKAKPVPTPEGLVYEVMCENCGPRKLTIEWPEIIAVRQGISPHIAYQGQQVLRGPPTVWGFDQASMSWFPDVRCAHCGTQSRLPIPPLEVEGGLRAATTRGWLAPQYVQELAQHCMAMKQRQGMR